MKEILSDTSSVLFNKQEFSYPLICASFTKSPTYITNKVAEIFGQLSNIPSINKYVESDVFKALNESIIENNIYNMPYIRYPRTTQFTLLSDGTLVVPINNHDVKKKYQAEGVPYTFFCLTDNKINKEITIENYDGNIKILSGMQGDQRYLIEKLNLPNVTQEKKLLHVFGMYGSQNKQIFLIKDLAYGNNKLNNVLFENKKKILNKEQFNHYAKLVQRGPQRQRVSPYQFFSPLAKKGLWAFLFGSGTTYLFHNKKKSK
jgi:hypothetical protein